MTRHHILKIAPMLWTFVLALALAACAVPIPSIPMPTPVPETSSDVVVDARLGEDVILGVRETARVVDSPDRFGITLVNVSSDNRCPKEVQCVEAGDAPANHV